MMSNSFEGQHTEMDAHTTHFGFRHVNSAEKQDLVRGVFDSVASRYDLMNDAMSLGVHRLWKSSLVDSIRPKAGIRHLDVAGGTGDIAFRVKAAAPDARVSVCDINDEMLKVGQSRADTRGFSDIRFVAGNAEALPFKDMSFDVYTIAFGIRNVTHIDRALAEARRILKPGGRFLCLEFSPAVVPLLKDTYDAYSFHVIPKLGAHLAGDRDSYQYLVESIRRFPAPGAFAEQITSAGLKRVSWRTMSLGVVALHSAWRI